MEVKRSEFAAAHTSSSSAASTPAHTSSGGVLLKGEVNIFLP